MFREQFGALAANRESFHQTMRGIFGEAYDAQKAEQYRQSALAGNFSWMPPVQWVGEDVLGEANGAYDGKSGTVFLNRALQQHPALAASTYVEEAGHHLDAQLNTVDSAGDEGELFRRILSGERLTQAQIADIRAENDKGIIHVDGKEVAVEFWKNPFKAVGKAISGTAKAIGKAVSNTAKDVGNAAVSVGRGLVGAGTTFLKGIGEGVGGFVTNLAKGKVGDAFHSLVRGADKAFFQAPARAISGILDGAEHLVNGVTRLLGPLGRPIRAVASRAIDAGRTIHDTVNGMMRDVFRTITETPIEFVRGVEESVRLAVKGQWGEAAKRFGLGMVRTITRPLGGMVDLTMRALQGAVNAALTLNFVEAPSRALSDTEIQQLKQLYGDSIDYSVIRIKQGGSTDWVGMPAHVVGNTIYLPTSDGNGAMFNADGTLTGNGMDTLLHEACHVWQNQNGGGDYIHRSQFSQLIASLKGGSRNDAYEWRDGYNQGKPFEELNPEQQASLIEGIGLALKNDGMVKPGDWNPPLNAQQLQYVLRAWELVRRGEGAR
jgi:hypothetical protein